MFRVYINKGGIYYRGCPETGVDAVDWRRAHALPETPTSFVKVIDLRSFVSEPLCRLRLTKLDNEADLILEGGRVYLDIPIIRVLADLLPNWQIEDGPLTAEEQEALAQLIETYFSTP